MAGKDAGTGMLPVTTSKPRGRGFTGQGLKSNAMSKEQTEDAEIRSTRNAEFHFTIEESGPKESFHFPSASPEDTFRDSMTLILRMAPQKVLIAAPHSNHRAIYKCSKIN